MRPLLGQALDKHLVVLIFCLLLVRKGVRNRCLPIFSTIKRQNAALDTTERGVLELFNGLLGIIKLLKLHKCVVEVFKHRSNLKKVSKNLSISYLLIVKEQVPIFFSKNSLSSR